MKRQTSNGIPEQLSFGWEERGCVGHGNGGEAVSGAAGQVVGQVPTAEEGTRALKQDLMERVADEANLREALRRVCANKGSAGVDGMDVTELKAWMSVRANREKLRDKLISGEYEPAPALSGKGWWRLADTPQAHRAMSLEWFQNEGLLDPEAFYLELRNAC